MLEKIKKNIGNNIRQYTMVIALIAIVLFFQITLGGVLLKPMNVTNLILQNSYILILAIGMLLCLITGNVDLSVGSVIGFIGALSGVLIVNNGWSVPVTIGVCLLAGLLIGAWNGFWIAYMKIPAFIATLAGMLVFRGLTMAVMKGQTIGPFPESYQLISTGFIPDVFHGRGLNIFCVLVGVLLSAYFIVTEIFNRRKKQKYNFRVPSTGLFVLKLVVLAVVVNLFFVWLALNNGIPNVFILIGLLIVIYSFITQKTVAGRHVYAYGGNAKAAELSGVKTKRILFAVYTNMGLLAAIAGIVFTGRLNAATPKAGTGFEMDAIAACCIGGASASGGVGYVSGAIIGGLIMGVLNNGMSLMGISTDWQQAFKGLVLLSAVAFDVYTKSKAKK